MPDRHGPYRRIRFLLEIDGVAKAGFSRCALPAARTDVIAYREGNDPPAPRKLAGLNRHDPLVLESGATDDSIALAEWRQLVEQGKLGEARRAIAVVLLDEEGGAGPRWEFRNAWPSRYVAPDLDADRSEVAIERLGIVHEGMERTA
ncbi:phage tail protein [Halorubrum halodurans]|uniref:Phage tail protein n=1 Tax=Halorubrum halodurans TaxID=1383851 RepID=A0A256ILZ6_9EURY|nr:phage tail protein [Halorubrum halodurans]OYR57182.1 phage tail protein [Halorubrum halodurans]